MTGMRYTVGRQRQTTIIDAAGDLVSVWQIPYTTEQGVKGTVTVPETDYTVDNVRQAIEADVAVHEGIAQLGQS